MFEEQQKLTTSDAEAGDLFGYSVSISSDGNTAIMGAYREDADDRGAAYVFTRSGSTWIQQQKLAADIPIADERFGFSVSISADGNTAIVGAQGNTGLGAAYVFTRSGETWTQRQKIQGDDTAANDGFGVSVSISSDGNTAIVGASSEGGLFSGAAYVFTRSGETWTQQQKIAGDFELTAHFGNSVSLSSDGDTAIVGADGEEAAYAFTRSGETWTQQQKLVGDDTVSNDSFGISVSLSDDGDTVLIGSCTSEVEGVQAGAVYVFTRTGGTWTQRQKLVAAIPLEEPSLFGISVSLSSDGSTALIGAQVAEASYVFTRSGEVWTEQQILTGSDALPEIGFGRAVSIAGDDLSTVLIGAYGDNQEADSAGSAYVFTIEVPEIPEIPEGPDAWPVPIIPRQRPTTQFIGELSGTVTFTDGTEDQFSATLDDMGNITTSSSDSNQVILELQNSTNWLQEVFAMVSNTLALNPLGTPSRVANSAVIRFSGRASKTDGTVGDFTVQFNNELGAYLVSGDISAYGEFSSDDIVTWLGALVGESQVTV